MAGRPTKYDPSYHPEHAYKLAMLSHTDEEIADFFGIEPSTFYLWKHKHPEFSEAVRRGKIPADADVAISFHKRACGYEYESEKIFFDRDAAHPDERIVRARTTVHVPPDPGAALNWLKNRQPDKWRDRKDHTVDPGPAGQEAMAKSKPFAQVFVNGELFGGEPDGGIDAA